MRPRIVVQIDRLVVDAPKLDREAFESALRRELSQRLGGRGSPRTSSHRAVRAATAALEPREMGSSDGIGRAVASAVDGELTR